MSSWQSVDMWSAGVIIFTILAGNLPFHDENQTRLFRKIKAGTFSLDEEHWGGISYEARVRFSFVGQSSPIFWI